MIDYKNFDPKKSNKATLVISKLQQIKRANPDKYYFGHRIDENYDPEGLKLEDCINRGWSYVYEEDANVSVEDDYTMKGTEKDKNKKPNPLVTVGKKGEVFLWLQIDKEAFDELRRKESSAGLDAIRPKKKDGEYFIKDPIVATENTKIQDK